MATLLKEASKILNIPALLEPIRTARVAIAEPDEEYVRVSVALGINKIPLKLVQLAKVIEEECLGVYDYNDVVRYLDKQVERLSKNKFDRHYYEWRWHPVKEYATHRSWGTPHFASEVYNKFIPLPVMFAMEKIERRMHDAEFYITGIREFRDPFLGVTVPGSDTLLIVERWDEPTFR